MSDRLSQLQQTLDRRWRGGHPFRPRLSRQRRVLTMVLFVCLCAVIGGYWYLTDADRVRVMAEAYLSKVLGGRVEVGRANLSIFEGLRLDDVTRVCPIGGPCPPVSPVEPAILDTAVAAILRDVDPVHGGFGRAPKFPTQPALALLLAHHRRTGNPDTLAAVARAGEAMAATALTSGAAAFRTSGDTSPAITGVAMAQAPADRSRTFFKGDRGAARGCSAVTQVAAVSWICALAGCSAGGTSARKSSMRCTCNGGSTKGCSPRATSCTAWCSVIQSVPGASANGALSVACQP